MPFQLSPAATPPADLAFMLKYSCLRSSSRESMSVLTNEKCTACRRDSPQVSEAEIQELKPQLPDWTLVERKTIQAQNHSAVGARFSVQELCRGLILHESRWWARRG